MAMRQQSRIAGEISRPSPTTMVTSSADRSYPKLGAIPPAVPKTSDQQQSALPSLCQVIAMTLTYRRLGLDWATGPILCVIVPLICKVVLFCLNSLTQGHGFLTVALTSFLVLSWYQMIRTTAPNPEKVREAYQKSQLRVPIIMFAVSHGFIRLMLRVAGEGYENETRPDSLQWTPTIPWGVGIRPAVGFALIGAAVMMKYVGHNSVVRCSTMPLVSNHFYKAVTSLQGFFDSLASPSDNVMGGDLSLGSFHYRLHNMGQRYQHPSFLAGSVLLLLTALIGSMVGEYILTPYWQIFDLDRQDRHATNRARYLIDCTCILTMLLQTVGTLDGHSHELNPKRYYEQNRASVPPLLQRLWSLGVTTVFVPAASFLLICFYNGDYQNYSAATFVTAIFNELGTLLLFSVITAVSVGFYTAAIDEAAKSLLCTPGSRLQRFVREVTCGRAPNSRGGRESSITFEQEEGYVVDVALHSLMHSDADLVAQVSKSTVSVNPNYNDLERYEAERNENAIVAMANALLLPKKDRSEAPLEEDILRHSILESLGGSKTTSHPIRDSNGANSAALLVREEYPADERHRETIQYWVHTDSNTIDLQGRKNARANIEPKGVTLVRALCAYSGGLGEALIRCSHREYTYISWTLPPGAVVAAEYAMVALARCIEQNLEHTKANAADWRSTHISMFIPAAFNSAYRLHRGVHEFAQSIIRSKKEWHFGPDNQPRQNGQENALLDISNNTEQISKETPELLEILRACDGAVKIIMRQLRSSEGSSHGIRDIENALEQGCAPWIHKVMSQD